MRKTTVLMSLLLAAGAATAQEKVTVQLKWLPRRASTRKPAWT
jgi:hypothetical protein